VLHRPSEARLGRGLGLSLVTGVGAYLAYALYQNYADGRGITSPAAYASLAVLASFAIGGFYFLFIQPKSSDFVVEVEIECRKVTWPEWLVVRRSTGQVTVLMLFLLLFIFLVDIGLGYIRQGVM